MRKKVDSRIRTLVENCVKLRQRGLFVIVGDKGRDQVVNLHYMLSKTVVKARPSVLWCYKKDLYLSSHRKKRTKQIKKLQQRGLLDAESEDPFTLFVASTEIRYCYYSETHKVLGNTYGMCVLQDFEALTPNLMARTVETVEGGGLVVLLLSSLTSLSQLYSLTMDVHSRLRTESHQQVTGRFNERLVLSLASCPSCILMDDELNILPTSSLVQYIQPVPLGEDGQPLDGGQSAAAKRELGGLQESLADTMPAGSLVSKCFTLDQARAVVTFLDAASEKALRSTVALTAARGRGKSAALGLAIAGALALGYSNIFVTAPSPENLRTLFEFVFKGLDALGYAEHLDYDLVEAANPALGKAIVRVNVFRDHRQTVQYIQPQHHAKLAQAELLVIDEAAAIPLPVVKQLLGPYLVFLCSTVNGYEGTGRSLSLKLLQQLREQGAKLASGDGKEHKGGGSGAGAGAGLGRAFREVQLQEPIRYASGDKVESWLHQLLCLDAAEHVPSPPPRLPHPDECDLYYVNRDTLFSFHKASETFLQQMMSLYVASHYRNTPNDLLLMADAPAHHLFVLLGPVDETTNALPDVMAVVQVALEGAISKRAAMASLAAGKLPQGDLIPWTIGQQFQDSEFPALSGVRIVRIAVHPEMQRGGYGGRAVQLLRRYYQGELQGVMEDDEDDDEVMMAAEERRASNGAAGAANGGAGSGSGLLEEQLKPRQGLPPLLVNLGDRPPERLQYLGVSFGLTQQLLNFWRRAGFQPVYLRQTASDVTGEYTMIMLSALASPEVADVTWLDPFVQDFRQRLLTLLGGAFRSFEPALALTLLDPKLSWAEQEAQEGVQRGVEVPRPDGQPLSPYDLKRLQAYSNNLVDHHLIFDLVPLLARSYFSGRLPATLSYGQAAILVVLGLQQGDITACEQALKLPATQILALFNKAIRRLHGHLRAAKEATLARGLPLPPSRAAGGRMLSSEVAPGDADLDAELDEEAQRVQERMRVALQPGDLERYAVQGSADDFAAALPADGAAAALRSGGVVSVKSSAARKASAADAAANGGGGGFKGKNGGGGGFKGKGGNGDSGGMLYKKNKSGGGGKRGKGGGPGSAGKPGKKARV